MGVKEPIDDIRELISQNAVGFGMCKYTGSYILFSFSEAWLVCLSTSICLSAIGVIQITSAASFVMKTLFWVCSCRVRFGFF